MELVEILQEICVIPALAGHEEKMIRYMRDALTPFADEVRVDKVGNVVAKIEGTDPQAPNIMIFAHMDQLGFVVRSVTQDGFIQLERLGGIPEKVLPGLRVFVESENGKSIPGVLGLKAHHATAAEDKYKVIPYQDLYVDIGATTSEDVHLLGIEIGCPIVYEPSFQILENGRVSGTSLDDRGGCAVLVKLAEAAHAARPPATLFIVGTVQEEFNLRGAVVAANKVQPDVAISLDVMIAGDTPELQGRSALKLGSGPAIGLYSFHGRGTLNGTIPHPELVRIAKKAAATERIDFQRNAMLGILTDSSYVQLVGDGVPCIDLGYPARYTHTPIEVCDMGDLEGLLALVWAMVKTIGSSFNFGRD